MDEASGRHDVQALLSSPSRNYLIRSSGDQVKIDRLKGRTIGLYFSDSSDPLYFSPKLVDVYNGVSAKGGLKIVYVSFNETVQAFIEYFSEMPWIAVPFSDPDTRCKLIRLFKVSGIPHLVFLDKYGNILKDDGVMITIDYGVLGYPFTPQRLKELKEQEEEAERNQSLSSILLSPPSYYVPVTELDGKTIGLYFSLAYNECVVFTEKLVKVYEELKERGESFEIVSIPLDDDEDSFKQSLEGVPWLLLPSEDEIHRKLVRYFDLSYSPTLVILGPDGKTLHSNAVDAIDKHESHAYPLTTERFIEIEKIERAKLEEQTLESILALERLDFVIAKDGVKVPVSDLVGKTILLFFSAYWCTPCRASTPKLKKIYHTIKSKDDGFELIFVSFDRDQNSFDTYFSGMPWLALPFNDTRKLSLSRLFKVHSIPKLVAIGKTGKTVTTEAWDRVMDLGADAYPFTEDHLGEIEAEYKKLAVEYDANAEEDVAKKRKLQRTAL